MGGTTRLWRSVVVALTLSAGQLWPVAHVTAADLTAEVVLSAMARGQRALISRQRADGAWLPETEGSSSHIVGVTSLAVMALLTSGMTANDPAVKRGLTYLRKLPSDQPENTYDVSLLLMALVAARDANRTDSARIAVLAKWLEDARVSDGQGGRWSYRPRSGGGDGSNSQFALLALREAAEAGVVVNRSVWEQSRVYWETLQNPDGGFGYVPGNKSTGSMTVAGVASLAIVEQMLRTDEGVAADGTPPCCRPVPVNEPLERGIRWLSNHFAVGHNPGSGHWLLYYVYGVERAGRLSARRFFGEHDWYREGAAFLIANQNQRDGSWKGVGLYESEEDRSIVGTSLALLFLSKGLAPVLMSKLKYGPRDPTRPTEVVSTSWNQHPRDVRNLVEHVSGLPRWPALVTSQEVDLLRAAQTTGVDALLQAPMLFLTGDRALALPPQEIELLKEYVTQGGFLLACPSCQSAEFEASFRELVTKLVPPGEGELKPLAAEHPVYRSEHLLSPDGTPLFGIDVGCRTSIMYSPEDLGCLWSYWQRHDPPKRNPQLKVKVIRAMNIGVNIAAYATGREPPKSLDAPRKFPGNAPLDDIERGLLQVAQLRHTGSWNAAPKALRNLLLALNETVGLAASTRPKELAANDPNLFQYPLLYMHGRTRFSWSAEERQAVKLHLSRGGTLFIDSCCGSKPFDKSVRELCQQLYPDHPLDQIPVTHKLFSKETGHDVRRVRRRSSDAGGANTTIAATVREVEPFLEGIEVDGRLVVIYSKYDLSCALERQSTLACEGYLPEDAVKLATNIVLFALDQDLRLPEELAVPARAVPDRQPGPPGERGAAAGAVPSPALRATNP